VNIREQMVDDVGIDDAVEEMAADKSEIAVHGGEGALDEGPAISLEVVHVWVVVVKVGNSNCSC
jgi:hypothetical protein